MKYLAILLGFFLLQERASAVYYSSPCEVKAQEARVALKELNKCFREFSLDSVKTDLAAACSQKYKTAADEIQEKEMCLRKSQLISDK